MTGKIAKPTERAGVRKGLLGAALLGCMLCLTAAPHAVAAPAWLPAFDLSAPGRDAFNPAVAVDNAGDTVAVWERQDPLSSNLNVQVATRDPGGSFSTPKDLSKGSDDPDVAITPGGEAVVAWVHFDNPNSSIQVSTRPPGGSFSSPAVVATSQLGSFPQNLHVVVDAAGDAAVAWMEKDPAGSDPNQFSILASVRPAGGSFSTPEVVSPQPLVVGDNSSQPNLAIDAAGDVSVVWMYHDAAIPRNEVQVAVRPAGGSFSAPQTLSDTSQNADSPAVAMDSAGDAIAVWAGSDGTNSIIRASVRPANGSFSMPADDLSEPGKNADSPQIAMTPGGEATAVWSGSDGVYSIIQAATSPSPGGGFSTAVPLSTTGQNAFDPEVAVNAAGAATVVWKRSDGLNYIAQAATRMGPPDSYSVPIDLSATGQDVVSPEVSMDGEGDATAVWRRSNGTNDIAQAAGYDADPPELRNLSIPPSGMVGVPVSFSVSPFDIWPIASTAFDFGDGATADGASVSHTYMAKGTYQVTVTSTDAAGTPVSAGGAIAIAPSNDFKIGRLSLNRKKGTGTFAVTAPGPGKFVLSGKGVKKATKRVEQAGKVKLPIRARGKALKRLERRGKVRLSLTISFTPDGGTTLVKHKKVTLIKKLRR
jgi:PKD domain